MVVPATPQTQILIFLRVTALLLGLGAVCLEAHAEIYPWLKVVDSERHKIWRRESPTSSIKEVKVDMILDAPVERVWEVLRDVEHYHEFMPYVAEATVLREHGDTRIVYERFSAVTGRRRVLPGADRPDIRWQRRRVIQAIQSALP